MWPGRCANTPGPGQDLCGGPDVPQATRRARESGVNDEMALRTASYRPRNVESTNWSAIQPFVLDCAVLLPLNGWSSTTRVLRVLTQLAAWAAGEGLPLDPEVVLDPDSVERFIEVGANDDRSRATYRSVLRRVG